MYKIGIVGNGFVGSAVAFGFSPQCGCDVDDIKIYDKDETKSTHTLNEVVNDSDYIFFLTLLISNEYKPVLRTDFYVQVDPSQP